MDTNNMAVQGKSLINWVRMEIIANSEIVQETIQQVPIFSIDRPTTAVRGFCE